MWIISYPWASTVGHVLTLTFRICWIRCVKNKASSKRLQYVLDYAWCEAERLVYTYQSGALQQWVSGMSHEDNLPFHPKTYIAGSRPVRKAGRQGSCQAASHPDLPSCVDDMMSSHFGHGVGSCLSHTWVVDNYSQNADNYWFSACNGFLYIIQGKVTKKIYMNDGMAS